jgi:deoxyribodipyrimidine photolyase-related protein
MTAPGDWRVLQALQAVAQARACRWTCARTGTSSAPCASSPTRHAAASALRMEYFYREHAPAPPRADGRCSGTQPAGGQWNFDADNREAFGPQGPGFLPPPRRVRARCHHPRGDRAGAHALRRSPGRLDAFAWPVTRAQALQALQAFIDQRLPHFGRWQDAMWPGEPWLYHAHLAAR